jgi:ribonuclease PH
VSRVVSVEIIDGTPMLDPPHTEDVRAETDITNVVVTGRGLSWRFRHAEGAPFDRTELNAPLDLAPRWWR